MSRYGTLASARTYLTQGNMKKAATMLEETLRFGRLELRDLEEVDALLSVVSARATGRLAEQCQRTASSVAARKRPFLEELEANADSRARLASWPSVASEPPRARSAQDPLLIALARAADAGDECPVVRIMTANGLFVGRPGPSRGFLEAMRVPLRDERRMRRPSDPEWDPNAEVAELLHAIHDRVEVADSDEPTARTTYEARWFSTAGVLGFDRLAAVRVPLAAVVGWWIAGGVAVAPPTEGDKGSWFAGIAIPIG